MTKPIQLHIGYVGITREGKRVEIIANDGSNEYQWGSDEYDWYMTSGNFWRNGKEDEEDIVGPWVETPVEPPVDYNDGKWHRWAGGECPVHTSSVVHATFLAVIGEPRTESRAAHMFVWGDCDSPIVALRVTKEYVEPPKVPREFWVELDTVGDVCKTHKTKTREFLGTTLVHVREVLTDD
jgi:hypothetical protein